MDIKNCTEFVSGLELNEAIWRNHYQIVVSKKHDKDCTNPISFGSAFIFIYKNKKWLVTADHVIHPDLHGILDSDDCVYDSQRKLIPQEYNYFLINNVNVPGELQTIFTTLSGFNFFDKFTDPSSIFSEEELEMLTNDGWTIEDFIDRVDLAFCELIAPINPPCVTHALYDNNQEVLVAEGLPKLMLAENNVVEPNAESYYSVYGVVHNDVSSLVKFKRVNAPYSYIRYNDYVDGFYKFVAPIDIKHDDWAALSGSAMFDFDGNIVGMTLRVTEKDNFVWVLPMKTIIRFLDYAIAGYCN